MAQHKYLITPKTIRIVLCQYIEGSTCVHKLRKEKLYTTRKYLRPESTGDCAQVDAIPCKYMSLSQYYVWFDQSIDLKQHHIYMFHNAAAETLLAHLVSVWRSWPRPPPERQSLQVCGLILCAQTVCVVHAYFLLLAKSGEGKAQFGSQTYQREFST